MGIREDIQNGICHEEYILISSALTALANHEKVGREDVARWLIKNGFDWRLNSYFKRDHGEMESSRPRIPGGKNPEALRTLHFFATSEGIPKILYWHITSLVQTLKDCGQDIDASPFIAKTVEDRNKAAGRAVVARFFSSQSGEGSDTALRARITELEKELADIKRKSPTQAVTPAGSSQPSFLHMTDGLKLVAAVQERYLSKNWDPDDADTRPKKSDVVEWLKEQNPGMSNVAAEAIDRVAMPFSRGK